MPKLEKTPFVCVCVCVCLSVPVCACVYIVNKINCHCNCKFYFQIARALKLVLLPECQGLCGGAAIELMAKGGDPHAYVKHPIMQAHVNCNFSFSGVQTRFEQLIENQEAETGDSVMFLTPSLHY